MASSFRGLGKADRDFLGRVSLKNLGAKHKGVLVGPGVGLDNAVISTGGGRVMVVTADPISIIPSLGMEDSAWLTAHELASDVATSGVKPEFAVLDYNLPPSLRMKDFDRYVTAMGRECSKIGVAIIGGHTGRYPGSDFTVVGGGMMMGTAREDQYVTPSMAQEGDHVVMTKGAAIEATAVLAATFPETVKDAIGKRLWKKAVECFPLCSAYEDARVASTIGLRASGVTAMHDATEGGVLGGLFELSQACHRSITVDVDRLIVREECQAVCELFRLDQFSTVSEGTLIATCRPHRSSELVERLSRKGTPAAVIGRVGRRGRAGLSIDAGPGHGTRQYVPPRYDPYWRAYADGIRRSLR